MNASQDLLEAKKLDPPKLPSQSPDPSPIEQLAVNEDKN